MDDSMTMTLLTITLTDIHKVNPTSSTVRNIPDQLITGLTSYSFANRSVMYGDQN